MDIFNEIHQAYKQLDSRLKAEGFKVRVMRMFRAWEEWAVYPRDFLVKLQNTFLGLVLVISQFFQHVIRLLNNELLPFLN